MSECRGSPPEVDASGNSSGSGLTSTGEAGVPSTAQVATSPDRDLTTPELPETASSGECGRDELEKLFDEMLQALEIEEHDVPESREESKAGYPRGLGIIGAISCFTEHVFALSDVCHTLPGLLESTGEKIGLLQGKIENLKGENALVEHLETREVEGKRLLKKMESLELENTLTEKLGAAKEEMKGLLKKMRDARKKMKPLPEKLKIIEEKLKTLLGNLETAKGDVQILQDETVEAVYEGIKMVLSENCDEEENALLEEMENARQENATLLKKMENLRMENAMLLEKMEAVQVKEVLQKESDIALEKGLQTVLEEKQTLMDELKVVKGKNGILRQEINLSAKPQIRMGLFKELCQEDFREISEKIGASLKLYEQETEPRQETVW